MCVKPVISLLFFRRHLTANEQEQLDHRDFYRTQQLFQQLIHTGAKSHRKDFSGFFFHMPGTKAPYIVFFGQIPFAAF